jgi:uncharacterized integral membrane protein (TIGR00698 family)
MTSATHTRDVTMIAPRPELAGSTRPERRRAWMERSPGVLLAAGAALVGIVAHELVDVVSPHVVAVLVGVLLANVGLVGDRFRPGLRFAARSVLRAGIVLVGFRLSLADVADLGPRAVLAVAIVVTATFFGTQWLGARLGVSTSMSFLVGTGYSICGASAIAAAEPFSDATEEEVAYSLALVTLCGTLSIAVLPLLGRWFGMGDIAFGSWVGAAVHDVGQVVATASTRDTAALQAAVIVKLTRVAMLAPLLFGVALAARRRLNSGASPQADSGVRRPPLLPMFVVLFLVAVVIRTTGVLSTAQLGWIKHIETFLIGAGLVGLGSAVDLRKLRRLGGRPLVLGLASWVLVASAAFVAVHVAIV